MTRNRSIKGIVKLCKTNGPDSDLIFTTYVRVFTLSLTLMFASYIASHSFRSQRMSSFIQFKVFPTLSNPPFQ